MSIKKAISTAFRTQKIIRVTSKRESGLFDGYVAAVGREFAVLQIFSDTLHLDGFACFRFSEIESCDYPAPTDEFLDDVVRLRGLKRRDCPPLALDSLQGLLGSVMSHEGLVTLHMQFDDSEEEKIPEDLSNVCYIGKILIVGDNSVEMLCITPSADWEDEAETYDLDDICRVAFGGGYEEALMIVSSAKRVSLM